MKLHCFWLLLVVVVFHSCANETPKLLTTTAAVGDRNATGNIKELANTWEAWISYSFLEDLVTLLFNLLKAPTKMATGGGGAIQAIDVYKCGLPTLPQHSRPIGYCCIPPNSTIIDYKLPHPPSILRVRRPAHAADSDYIAKYSKAIALMKALPSDDPRNFFTQTQIHCAYCCNAYSQFGFTGLDLQIHFSWLFYPWHRYFLYFYERILGSLIDDDTFALPFWNWDSPIGMTIPAMYTSNTSSPLYNPFRDAKHLPRLINLDFDGIDDDDPLFTDEQQIDHNLKIMYRQLVSNAKTTKLFIGEPYRAGDQPGPGGGSLEFQPHGPVHQWTGDGSQPNREDIGTLYSASNDSIFFAHHGNIDRLWHLWTSFGGKHKNYDELDYLEAEFLFYDENAQLVRVKIKDCLDMKRMGYTYEEVDIPWLASRPTPARKVGTDVVNASFMVEFPVTLGEEAVSVRVKRERKRMGEEEEETLVVEGIEVEMGQYVKFNVYVNAPAGLEGVTPAASEFAGSFLSVPHRRHRDKTSMMKTVLRLGIGDLLEDLEAEGDESIVVTLVRRSGVGKIRVGGISIEFTT